MGKGSKETINSSNIVDKAGIAFRGGAFDKAREVANQRFQYNPLQIAGADPAAREAALRYQLAGRGIGIGMDAMQQAGGMHWDPATMQQYMSPYTKGVIDQNNVLFGDLRQNTMNDINQQAMQSQAFGGSRHGIAEGQALADLGKTQAYQNASLLQDAYGQGMGQFNTDRASQMQYGQNMANLGFGGVQGQMDYGNLQQQYAQAGNQAQRDEFLRQQGWSKEQLDALLKTMAASPYSTTGKQVTKTPGNLFGDILGAASTAAAFI